MAETLIGKKLRASMELLRNGYWRSNNPVRNAECIKLALTVSVPRTEKSGPMMTRRCRLLTARWLRSVWCEHLPAYMPFNYDVRYLAGFHEDYADAPADEFRHELGNTLRPLIRKYRHNRPELGYEIGEPPNYWGKGFLSSLFNRLAYPYSDSMAPLAEWVVGATHLAASAHFSDTACWGGGYHHHSAPVLLEVFEDAAFNGRAAWLGQFVDGKMMNESPSHSNMFRDIMRDPKKMNDPLAVEPAWLTTTVIGLVRHIVAERDYGIMPILADGLQEAGCEVTEVLEHLREPNPHCGNCWVIDAIRPLVLTESEEG